ncbi:serine/threonine-protein kinase [Edaphobacter aggregans]|uniref:serine/threonine-protein kinase n=1 Tax=Edaphobacter aggregans TaxID=570835 RepID=UPI00068D546A|nr:serine/threonine-protein kinase [Edaphobacter aggregans]
MTTEGSTKTIEKIGRYRITGELGRGGMGIVYRGEDRLIGRRVAIKTLTEVTPELRERFYVEARSGILSHQNIVTIYELGEHEGSPFIAMEYIEGDSLEKVLRERKRLPLLEAISIVEQLCAGLGYAHGHGVVHRDVKPANILVRPDGRVTIVDFGIARLADQTRQLTRTDTLLGTFHYIAPERLKGEASDGRADVWSVGVMLYEMLTGELPFKGSDVSSLYRVIHEPYVPLTEHLQDLPDGLNVVLDKALAKQVETRYATAEEMSFDLQVLAEGLKHDRVGSLLDTARRLTEENQYTSARTVLLQAQRIDPANVDAKALLGDVQDRISQVQRESQLRQIIEQAQDAAANRRWNDAVILFQQARKLDTEDALNLGTRLQHAQQEKEQQQRVLALSMQADEARSLGDLKKAQNYLGQALQIDDRSTEVRNAYADVLREMKGKQQQQRVESLLRVAQDESSRQRYTEPISRLREAAEIDPVHAEVQGPLLSTAARQKEAGRQQVLEKAGPGVQESLDREEFVASAEDRVTRPLEPLSGDESLFMLRSEIKDKSHDSETVRVDRNHTSTEEPATQKAGKRGDVQNVPEASVSANDLGEDFRRTLSPATSDKPKREQNGEHDAALTEPQQRVIDQTELLAPANRDAELTALLQQPRHEHENAERQAGLTAQLTEVLLKPESGTMPHLQAQSPKQFGAKKDTLRPKHGPRKVAEIRKATEKPPATKSSTPAKRAGTRWYIVGSAVVAAVVVAVAVMELSHRQHQTPVVQSDVVVNASTPAPAAPPTDMEINASPWATVVTIQDQSGKRIPLPSVDLTTPLRLDGLNSGSYKVTVASADGKQLTVECNVSAAEHLCVADMGSPEIRHVLMGEQR